MNNDVKRGSKSGTYRRLEVLQPRIRDTRIDLARSLEKEIQPPPEPKPGEPAELTLRDGDHERHVYVKVWDGQRMFWWQGFNWKVVHVKKSVWEQSFNAPLWWTFYGAR